MPVPDLIHIDMPGLAAAVDRMTAEEIDQLSFGAIRIDEEGEVILYSAVERRQSGWRHEAVARNFFTDIAPCLNNPAFKGRIDIAIEAGRLDMSFDEMMDLPNGARGVDRQVRIVSSTIDRGYWIFMQTYDSD